MRKLIRTILRKLGFHIIQSPEEIEDFYKNEDPWGYRKHPDDAKRKQKIINVLKSKVNNIDNLRVLDLGCGEGFITEDLPGREIIGLDISQTAIERAKRWNRKAKYFQFDLNKDDLKKLGKFDVIIATGILYKDYLKSRAINQIDNVLKKNGFLLTCHIKEWKIFEPPFFLIYEEEFPYKNYTERLTLYQKQ